MKIHRNTYPRKFMVRRVLGKRGGAESCPNADCSGGKAAGNIGVSHA